MSLLYQLRVLKSNDTPLAKSTPTAQIFQYHSPKERKRALWKKLLISGLGHEIPVMILQHLIRFKNNEIFKHTQVHKCVHTHTHTHTTKRASKGQSWNNLSNNGDGEYKPKYKRNIHESILI